MAIRQLGLRASQRAKHLRAIARHMALDSRRKFRGDPAYPAALAAGSSRFAEIRPDVAATRSAARALTES